MRLLLRLAVSKGCVCTQALGRTLELSCGAQKVSEHSIGKANLEADVMNEEEILKASM